ncbi:MAG: type III pantothenate kinase [Bacteroidales bacterium]|nr:type III pantothenate kinase [Bacteroidales bacterium]
MNILAIDIGNTKIKYYKEYNGKKEYKEIITSIALLRELRRLPINEYYVIVSDVRNIINKIKPYLKTAKKLILFNKNIKLPIKVSYKTPFTLGNDRIAAAVGAFVVYGNIPILIINAGTAITIDLVENGTFLGGAISPGIAMRFKALNEFTSKLPLVKEFKKCNIIYPAKTTKSCIKTGVIKGVVNELNAYINEFEEKYENGKVVLTGGDYFVLEKYLKKPIFVEKFLTISGLINILKMNV